MSTVHSSLGQGSIDSNSHELHSCFAIYLLLYNVEKDPDSARLPKALMSRVFLELGGGPFSATLNIRCRIIIGIQKGTIILTTTQFLN